MLTGQYDKAKEIVKELNEKVTQCVTTVRTRSVAMMTSTVDNLETELGDQGMYDDE